MTILRRFIAFDQPLQKCNSFDESRTLLGRSGVAAMLMIELARN